MRARNKFLVGGSLVLVTVGYLMATGIQDTGVYYLTPSELASRVRADQSFYNVGMKMGARVVKGSIQRDVSSQTVAFRVTDGVHSYPVVYRGLTPDTFTDEADVVVEGRLRPDGTFHATTLLAKCGSRYEAAPERAGT
jgi:cytochrome c-type biogenesis protein CcmE